ncbi:unnamed protein product [Dovyalis caffra]|uniref:Uncharacterized protein n=1 Tax=Dovyalis caffra TaxID=77055 RepID=A0AAV1SNY1_9ROSI|nr:unnamed protein product [Dovyalis caffra]
MAIALLRRRWVVKMSLGRLRATMKWIGLDFLENPRPGVQTHQLCQPKINTCMANPFSGRKNYGKRT